MVTIYDPFHKNHFFSLLKSVCVYHHKQHLRKNSRVLNSHKMYHNFRYIPLHFEIHINLIIHSTKEVVLAHSEINVLSKTYLAITILRIIKKV